MHKSVFLHQLPAASQLRAGPEACLGISAVAEAQTLVEQKMHPQARLLVGTNWPTTMCRFYFTLAATGAQRSLGVRISRCKDLCFRS